MSLYECDLCEWSNPDWRYGFGDAGASYHAHLATAHAPISKGSATNRPTQRPASNSTARKRLAAHTLGGYFVAEDAAGDLGIWLEHVDRPGYPTPVVYRFQFGDDETLWETLVAAIEAAK